jgi:hypothetical protein
VPVEQVQVQLREKAKTKHPKKPVTLGIFLFPLCLPSLRISSFPHVFPVP